MAEGQFTPDLLLTVGADVTALRQQLAQISRELNLPPVQVRVEAPAEQVQRIGQAMNAASQGAANATAQTAKYYDQLKRVTLAQAELQNFRYLINPQAFADNQAGLERVTAALRNVDDVFRRVNAGTQVSRTEWAQFGSSLATVRVETEKLLTSEKGLLDFRLQQSRGLAALAEQESKIRREGQLSDQQMGRVRIQAEKEYLLAKSQGLGLIAQEEQRQRQAAVSDQQMGKLRIAAEKEYQLARSQGLGQLAQEEQRLRGVRAQELRDIQRNQREDQAATLQRIQNIRRIETELARLITLQNSAYSAGAAVPQGATRQVGALQGALGTLQGGGNVNPTVMAALSNETARQTRELTAVTRASREAGLGLEGMFGQFGRYIRVAGFLTIVYGGMRAVFSGVQEYITVDKQLRTIAATMEDSAERSRVMRDSWKLLVEANQQLGTSFSESGEVLITLQKILGNNTEEIQGAFIPSLALASIAEGNQVEILRVLVGSYQLFGRSLGDAVPPAEKFERIANAIANASVASIQDISGFTTALQTVIPAATGAGVSIEDTLTLLTLLQNGMQSASRAGTGLARLMIDMQRFAPQISRIFDIPFDVDQPVPVVEMMTQLAQRLRDAGPLTTELAGKIREAIPDERAQRALQTFVEQLDKFLDVQKRVAEGGDRISQLIREQSLRIEASIGRLRGAIFREFSEALNTITGSEFGDQSGIVNFIDGITRAVQLGGTVLKDYLATVKAIGGAFIGMYDLVFRAFGTDTISLFKRGLEEIAITARHFLLTLRTIPEIIRPSGDQTRKQVFDKFLEDFVNAEKEVRSVVQGYRQKAEQEVIDLSAGPKPTPPPPRPVPLSDSFKASLIAEANDIQKKVQAEFYRNRTDLPIEIRISNAQHVLAEAEKVAREARSRFEQGDFPTANERESGAREVESTVRKVEQARASLRKLNEEALEQAYKVALLDEKNIEQLNKEFQLRIEIDARRRVATGDYSRSHEREMKLLADLNKTQDEGVKLELYELSVLEAQEELRQKSLSGVEQQTEALRRQLALVSVIAREAGLSPQAAQTAEIDRSFGIDKLTQSTRELAATMNLVGVEAAKATVAARQGFESFEEMLIIAERARARIGPPTARERDALAGVEGANRLAEATRASQLKLAEKQVVDLAREERILRETFGATTEETIKQTLAIRNTGMSWEELSVSLDESDRKYAVLIAKIAQATEASKLQAEILALMAAGFDEVTARMIATTNAADRLKLGQLNEAGDRLEEFNTRLDRLRVSQGRLAEESARLGGDMFGYYIASLRNASAQSNEFWSSLKSLAEDTARAVSQSWSDFFFDSFQNKLNAGKDAWKSFLTSMERALADFMSKQLVRSFLNILTGGGSGNGGGVISEEGAFGLTAGVASGFGSIGSNYTAGGGGFAGIGAALFGLPMTPTTVRAGLPPSNPEIDDPTSLSQIQTVRQTSGLIGTGGQVSKDLQLAGAVAAAYAVSQSVLKLTSSLSTEQDRNAGIGGAAGTVIGGLAGAYFGGAGGAALGAGAGGILGNFLGGLFGSDDSPAGRFDELSRTIGTVQTALEAAVAGAKTFTDLYNVLLGFQGGGALAAANNQAVSISAGGQPISSLSQEAFLTALRANPSSLIAGVQAGVSPDLLGPLNQEVVQTILAKVAALDSINQQITRTIAEISALSIAPATGISSLDTLHEQAVNFRATVDQLVAANEAQVTSLESLLRVTTDPAQILQYTTEIKELIQDRYQTETQLVQQFAGQLDSLATSLTNVGKSIEEQIFNLELSNFGPTNPLQGFQLAQGRFNTARAAFEADPTAENAQAVQEAVDPLLKAASEVFTRPSPEYRAIFAEVVDVLESVKVSVDSQAADIQGALQAALGTSISIQDLTQRNTAAMAADMRQLLAIVQAQAAAAGVGLGAGSGFLNPSNFPAPSGQVTAPTPEPAEDDASESGALLAAVGTIGALAGPLLTIADKLGATDYLKNLIKSIFTTTPIGTSSTPVIGGGSSISNPDILSGAYSFTVPTFTFPDFMSGASYSPYSFYDYSAISYPEPFIYDYGFSAFAKGGPVPGSGMGDTVRAMLEPGEFVVNRDAVARNREWLEQINGPGAGVNRRGILHFQTGGMVPGTTSSNTVASAEDIAILLYLQSIAGASSADAQALLAELLRQAEASQNPTVTGSTGPATPSTVSGDATTVTPSVVAAAEANATIEMIRTIQTLLRGGQTVTGLFSSGDLAEVLGPAGSALGIASGVLGLFSGISDDDPFGAAAGGVQLAASTISLLAQTGVISGIPYVGAYAQAVLAAIQIAQIAANGDLSDEEKAIQSAKVATTAAAVLLAGPTFGASLAVLQIWDFVERLRAGQPFDQAIVSANDPTTLLNMFGGEKDLSISGAIFNPSERWMDFIPEIYENAGTQGEGFDMLLKALPYVKSKEELGQLLNTQKNWVSTITGIPLSAFGGAYSPYSVQTIPGIGPETHGVETTPVDWGPTAAAFQQLIDIYKAMLPGREIVGGYGTQEGSLNPEASGRLWNQFRLNDPGWFSRATYAGAPMPFDVLNSDSQFVNTSSNEAGANYVLDPYWVPYGTTQVYAGVSESGVNMFAPWGPGYVNELGIYFDPRTGSQVWVAPGGPFPPTIASMYQVSPEWRLMQALYGLPEVQPVTAPNVGPTAGYTPPQPTGNPVIDQNLPQIQAISQDLGVSPEYAALILGQQISDFSSGGMQKGGWVPGVSRGADSVPTWLEPGEFVVPRAIAKANSELLMSLLGDGGGTWDGLYRSDFGGRVSSAARELIGGSWDGLHRADRGSTISAGARSGDYRGEGGVSSVALHIAEGAIRIDGARDPKVVSKDVLEAIEQNIRTGRLGQVIASRVRPQRSGV